MDMRLRADRRTLSSLGWAGLILALLLALVGCATEGQAVPAPRTGPPMTVTIVSKDWNGWDKDHKPTPSTVRIAAEQGATGEFQGLGERVQLTVEKVDADQVEIKLSSAMAPRSEGSRGYNMRDTQDRFVVQRGKPTEFMTPSLDAGMQYEVTLTND